MKFTEQTLNRAVRTFIQAALSYMLVNIAAAGFGDSDVNMKSALVGLIVASIAAGLSAVMNLEKPEGGEDGD